MVAFWFVVGADASLAQNLLEACGNNLEMAINMHMEGAASSGGDGGAQSHPDAAVRQQLLLSIWWYNDFLWDNNLCSSTFVLIVT